MASVKEFTTDKLRVKIYPNRKEMGSEAASEAAAKMRELLASRDELNVIFAAAPSQNEFLAALVADDKLDWARINAFHMDEYIGLAPDAPQGFGNFLKAALFGQVPFKSVNYLKGDSADPGAECQRYARLLAESPADIVCMGIGENGHIAFNDPHVALFDDPETVKIVELDEECRNQQVHDGCFATIDDVPKHAMTLTIPALVSAEFIFCMVPAPSKAEAVRRTLTGPVTEACPASIIREHASAILYLDPDSAGAVV